jgi:putative membrane protein
MRAMQSLFAFLHHVAAFALVGALAAEFVLIRGALDEKTAARMLAADAVYGASAGIVVAVGLLRAFYFEKGAAYYLHSIPFLLKFLLVVIAGLLSMVPTREYLSWYKPLKQGRLPVLDERKRATLRKVIHIELALVVLILLCAALMARGIGYLG